MFYDGRDNLLGAVLKQTKWFETEDHDYYMSKTNIAISRWDNYCMRANVEQEHRPGTLEIHYKDIWVLKWVRRIYNVITQYNI